MLAKNRESCNKQRLNFEPTDVLTPTIGDEICKRQNWFQIHHSQRIQVHALTERIDQLGAANCFECLLPSVGDRAENVVIMTPPRDPTKARARNSGAG